MFRQATQSSAQPRIRFILGDLCNQPGIFLGQGQWRSPRSRGSYRRLHADTRLRQCDAQLLTERLTPRGRPADPRWRLETQLAETTERIGITETDVATRANLALTATYRLIDLADGSIAFQATTATVTSFNILRDEYAPEVSRQSARDASLEQVAEDISRRLAIHFRSRPSP